VEIALDQGLGAGSLSGGRVDGRCANVTENGRVEAASEARRTKVGKGTDPVIVDWPICVQNDRVPLAGENPQAVDDQRLRIDTVDFDDSLKSRSTAVSEAPDGDHGDTYQGVRVDREVEEGIARDGHKTQAIAFVAFDTDYSERDNRSINVATFAVDECSDRVWDEASGRSGIVIPSISNQQMSSKNIRLS
jgi:hypothetical protein